jgi:hypothetical protein
MFGYLSKAIRTVAVVGNWSLSALADGKVTVEEVVKLVRELGNVYEFDLEFDVPFDVAESAIGVKEGKRT